MHRRLTRFAVAATIAVGVMAGGAGVASAAPIEISPCGEDGKGADLVVDGHYVRGCVYP